MTYLRRIIFIFTLILLLLGLFGCGAYTGRAVIADGEYDVPMTLEGGSGRASIESPVKITVKDGKMTARLIWSSSHYDYMITGGKKYLPVDAGEAFVGHSVFEIPIERTDEGIAVIADTTAMSVPHEIEYTLRFDWPSLFGGTDETDKMSDRTDNERKDVSENIIDEEADVPVNITDPDGKIIEFNNITELSYAEMFFIAKSDYGYAFIHIKNSGDYLIVPEGKDPAGIKAPQGISVLCKPIAGIYLVSSSAMDIFAALDEDLDDITFSSLEKKDWCVDEAVRAMDEGRLKYAGKYSAPDYELLVSEGCGLAIENTMIYHKPEVIEKLKALGIPVLVEVSSYEPHPLGRMEWIKLYGELLGKEDLADEIFKEKLKELSPILEGSTTSDIKDKNVSAAFFYVTSTGAVNVRKSNDYISRMISMAGGDYIPKTEDEEDEEENALSTVNMQMEAFYDAAVDADILIYNGTVGGEIKSIDDLIKKDKLFADFKAVKNGRVYTTDDNLYQKTMSMPDLILDLDRIFESENVSDKDLIFLKKVL